MKILRIPAFKDNYIWVMTFPNSKSGIVIDPGDAKPVLEALNTHGLSLCAILITHHHWDHSGGVEALLAHTQSKIPVYASSKSTIPHVTHPVQEGDSIHFDEFNLSMRVLEIPGHTLDHIAFVGTGFLFCGDTLFTGGCGRVFEGTPEQMLSSLSKLKQLPPDTLIYCGHEYTEANLKFALAVEPHNSDLINRMKETSRLRSKQEATVPSTLELELKTNPFLRTDIPKVIKAAEAYAKRSLTEPSQVFAAIREWKNEFKT